MEKMSLGELSVFVQEYVKHDMETKKEIKESITDLSTLISDSNENFKNMITETRREIFDLVKESKKDSDERTGNVDKRVDAVEAGLQLKVGEIQKKPMKNLQIFISIVVAVIVVSTFVVNCQTKEKIEMMQSLEKKVEEGVSKKLKELVK